MGEQWHALQEMAEDGTRQIRGEHDDSAPSVGAMGHGSGGDRETSRIRSKEDQIQPDGLLPRTGLLVCA